MEGLLLPEIVHIIESYSFSQEDANAAADRGDAEKLQDALCKGFRFNVKEALLFAEFSVRGEIVVALLTEERRKCRACLYVFKSRRKLIIHLAIWPDHQMNIGAKRTQRFFPPTVQCVPWYVDVSRIKQSSRRPGMLARSAATYLQGLTDK